MEKEKQEVPRIGEIHYFPGSSVSKATSKILFAVVLKPSVFLWCPPSRLFSESKPGCSGPAWHKRWEVSRWPWDFALVPYNLREASLGLGHSRPFLRPAFVLELHRNWCFSPCKTTHLGCLCRFSFLGIGVSILSPCISWKLGASSLNMVSSSGEMSHHVE